MVRTAGSVQQIEAAPEDVGLTSEGMAKLKRHVQGYVDAGKFPGAISMVQRRGKVVHFETYGRSDLEAGKRYAEEAWALSGAGAAHGAVDVQRQQTLDSAGSRCCRGAAIGAAVEKERAAGRSHGARGNDALDETASGLVLRSHGSPVRLDSRG